MEIILLPILNCNVILQIYNLKTFTRDRKIIFYHFKSGKQKTAANRAIG